MRKIGYTRVSTADQNLDRQIDALTAAGCEIIYQEKKSGKNADRPELNIMLDSLQPGDIVIVQKLDRLGRSLIDLLRIVDERISAKQANFISLTEGFDTTTPGGKLIFQIMGALAEFERHAIIERVKDGLRASRERGVIGGRKKMITGDALERFKTQAKDPKLSIGDLSKEFGINKNSIWRYIKELGIDR